MTKEITRDANSSSPRPSDTSDRARSLEQTLKPEMVPDAESASFVVSGAHVAPARTQLQEVAGYEVLHVLGRGGMGVVYKARQRRLKRLVALKMIVSGEHAGEQELARFRTEAEAAAELKHPSIVEVYELGEHSGLPFLSLEYVDGKVKAGPAVAEKSPP